MTCAPPSSPAALSKRLRSYDDSVPRWALRAGWATLAIWLVLGCVFTWSAPAFLSHSTASLRPPPTAPSEIAARMQASHFADLPASSRIVLAVESSGDIAHDDAVRLYTKKIHAFASDFARENMIREFWIDGYWLHPQDIRGDAPDWMVSRDGHMTIVCFYYSSNSQQPVDPLRQRAGVGGNWTVAVPGAHRRGAQTLDIGGKDREFAKAFVAFLTPYLNAAAINGTAEYKVGLTGDAVVAVESSGNLAKSLGSMELIVLPAAFVVLVCFLRHFQMMLVPLLCMGFSAGLSFTMGLPIAWISEALSGDVPEIVISTCVALSIDYSLFLLTRFLEATDIGLSHWDAVNDMMVNTGHTITVSALLISVAFFCASVLPIPSLRMAGLCLGLTALSALVANLTLIPALLTCFSRWLVKPTCLSVTVIKERFWGSCTCTGEDDEGGPNARGSKFHERIHYAHATRATSSGTLPPPELSNESTDDVEDADAALCEDPEAPMISNRSSSSNNNTSRATGRIQKKRNSPRVTVELPASPAYTRGDGDFSSPAEDETVVARATKKRDPDTFYFKLASAVRRSAMYVVFAVLVLSVPFLYVAPQIQISVNRDLSLDRTSNALVVRHSMEGHGVDQGRLLPANVMMQSVDGTNVISREGFATLHALGQELYDSLNFSTSGGITYDALMSPAHVWGDVISYEEAVRRLNGSDPTSREYQRLCARFVNGSEWVNVAVLYPFGSYSDGAAGWVRNVRNILATIERQERHFKFYLSAPNAGDVDAADLIVGAFPLISLSLCGALTVAVGIFFRSFLIPIRLLFALAYTIAITIGLGVYIYQTNIFYWLFPYLRAFDQGGLAYVVPAIILPVCIALGLDYDIFLITRIIEYRQVGMSDGDAIVMGVAKTGSTISGAGLIMAIAFGGLLAAPETQMNQFGFLLMTSVLLDTFLIRTIMVPAMMFLAAKANWWPRTMPPVQEDRWGPTGYSLIPSPSGSPTTRSPAASPKA